MSQVLTANQLALICPKMSKDNLEPYSRSLTAAMAFASINTVTRIAAFLGQVCHESYEFKYMREVWDTKNVPNQLRYERDAAHAWPPTALDPNNRLAHNLGNSEKGDGFIFRGWGPIQVTGRSNTLKASTAIFGDDRLIKNPATLDDPGVGMRGAAWYWTANNINAKADALSYELVTRAVNGGLTNHDKRLWYYYRALEVLGKEAVYLNT